MTAPSSLTINLPPTFSGSFWSAPYRRGLHSLYGALQRGIDENSSLLALVEHRASLEYAHAEALAAPTPSPNLPTPLFKAARNAEKPASSITHAFRIIEREALGAQSNAHAKVAGNLDRNILGPFGRWSDEHERRVRSSWDHVDAVLERYETQQAEVERQRATYESKCRSADEAEDDARFAGGEVLSPSPSHSTFASSQQHTAAPSEASSVETKATSRDASSDATSTTTTEQTTPEAPAKLDPERLKRRETLRDQFGFRRAPRNKPEAGADRYTSVSLSPRAASAQLPGDATGNEAEQLSTRAVSAGSTENLKRSAGTLTSTLSAALSRASEAPAIVSLRGALGGLNEPRHVRLRREAEQAEEAYRTGVRALDRERLRVEETLMDHYTYAESWEGERARACRTVLLAYNAAFMPLLPQLDASLSRTRSLEPSVSPTQSLAQLLNTSCTGAYLPLPEVFHPYYNGESTSLAGAGIASFGADLVAYSRAETLAHEDAEADDASGAIRAGVGKKGSLPALPLALSALLAALERAYDDAARWPAPASKEGEAKASTSEAALYANAEKRKAWVYDVPLVQSHACREQIIAHITSSRNPGAEAGAGLDALLARFDAPTLAATVKLWALELADSLVSQELWDAVNSTYAAAAAQEQEAKAKAEPADKAKEDQADQAESKEGDEAATPKLDKGKGRVGLDPALEEKIRKGILADLSVVLGRLHKLHLVCLDAIVGHLARLVKKTSTNEPDPVYLNKLGLALGRALIRAPRQTPSALFSRAPTLLTMDLVGHYEALFPDLLARKAHEGEVALAQQRRTPIRKRTKPVDVRTTRRNLNASAGSEAVPVLPPKQEHLAPGASATMASSPTQMEAPPLPGKPEQPAIVTNAPKPQQAEEEAPTPLADRVLDGAPAAAAAAPASGDKLSAASAAAGESIDRPASSTSTSSAYATPPSEKADATPAAEGPKPSASGSNVARLSRQFGSTGSGSGARTAAVRGARPMGARMAHGNNRESRDLAPSTEETSGAPTRTMSERRRSWSRTMELSDKDLVAGDDVDE